MKTNSLKSHIASILFISFCCASNVVLAQEEWEESGEIEDTQVIIEKDRKIELGTANRTYQKVAPSQINIEAKPQQYNFNDHLYQGSSYLPSPGTRRLTSTSGPKTGNNYVKLGFGNYVSPLAELSLNTVQKNLTAGLSFNHLSFARGPVDGSNSASSDNDANLYAVLNNKKNALLLDIDFSSLKRYHYGFSDGSRSNINPTKQIYNRFGLNLGLKNRDENTPIDYSATAGFYTLNDNFSVKESGFQGQLLLSAPLVDNLTLFTETNLLLTKYEDTNSISRNLINIKGGVSYELGQLNLRAAANAVFTNDTINNSSDFKLYPYITVDYQLNEQWQLRGGLVGDLEAVTLKTISHENPFVAQNLPLVHTNKRIEVYGQLDGQLNQQFSLSGGASFANYENLYFYTDTLRFNLAFEPDATNVLKLFTSLNFDHKNIFSISTRFEYLNYSTKTVSAAWHRPNFISSISARYQFNEKLSFGSSLSVLSGIKSFNPETSASEKLDTIIDLGIDAVYQINDKFSGFIELDNVLSKKYERYFNYQNRSFMTHLGVIYSF